MESGLSGRSTTAEMMGWPEAVVLVAVLAMLFVLLLILLSLTGFVVVKAMVGSLEDRTFALALLRRLESLVRVLVRWDARKRTKGVAELELGSHVEVPVAAVEAAGGLSGELAAARSATPVEALPGVLPERLELTTGVAVELATGEVPVAGGEPDEPAA